jgi:hypothetical protein
MYNYLRIRVNLIFTLPYIIYINLSNEILTMKNTMELK